MPYLHFQKSTGLIEMVDMSVTKAIYIFQNSVLQKDPCLKSVKTTLDKIFSCAMLSTSLRQHYTRHLPVQGWPMANRQLL